MSKVDRKKGYPLSPARTRSPNDSYEEFQIGAKGKKAAPVRIPELKPHRTNWKPNVASPKSLTPSTTKSGLARKKRVFSAYFSAVENLLKADQIDTESAAATAKRQPSREELNFYSSVFKPQK